jgi:hypothetical protein
MNKNKKVTLEFCEGTNAGSAIYLQEHDADGNGCGSRMAGPKCWGYVKCVGGFEMNIDDLQRAIEKMKKAIKFLKAKK